MLYEIDWKSIPPPLQTRVGKWCVLAENFLEISQYFASTSYCIFLLLFAIFVTQSFHSARKILVTFAIFAKFAISSILF